MVGGYGQLYTIQKCWMQRSLKWVYMYIVQQIVDFLKQRYIVKSEAQVKNNICYLENIYR